MRGKKASCGLTWDGLVAFAPRLVPFLFGYVVAWGSLYSWVRDIEIPLFDNGGDGVSAMGDFLTYSQCLPANPRGKV